MSRARLIRRVLLGVFLLAIAIQVGVFLALREKQRRADNANGAGDEASNAENTIASETLPVPIADAGIFEQEIDAAIDSSVPNIDAASRVAVVAVTETPRERRRRERLEARQAAKLERDRLKREKQEAERKRIEAARRVDAGAPTPAPVTKATVSFQVSPVGAALNLDANFIGKAPLRAVQIPAGDHTLAVSASGYAPATQRFTVRSGQNRTIKITLSPAPKDIKTTEPTVAKRPATPRVSGTGGNASRGRGLIGARCNGCHRKRGVGGVGPRSRRRASWARFFAGGYHDRYERIGGLVSRSAMTDIKAYLMENAKCDSNTAGAKCT